MICCDKIKDKCACLNRLLWIRGTIYMGCVGVATSPGLLVRARAAVCVCLRRGGSLTRAWHPADTRRPQALVLRLCDLLHVVELLDASGAHRLVARRVRWRFRVALACLPRAP